MSGQTYTSVKSYTFIRFLNGNLYAFCSWCCCSEKRVGEKGDVLYLTIYHSALSLSNGYESLPKINKQTNETEQNNAIEQKKLLYFVVPFLLFCIWITIEAIEFAPSIEQNETERKELNATEDSEKLLLDEKTQKLG